MKNILYVLMAVLVASACSSPKYTASFNSYDRHANNPTSLKSEAVIKSTADTQQEPVVLASTSPAPVQLNAAPKEEVKKTYLQMTKSERKALRTHLRSEIKSYVKEQKKNFNLESTKATAGMDNDLKLAAIFGAVGVVAMFIGGDVFWVIGGIALIIGVVFFVKWLIRQ